MTASDGAARSLQQPLQAPLMMLPRRPFTMGLFLMVVATVALVAPGFILDSPQPDPTRSDAVVVISGDEQLARFREGLRLYKLGLARYLVFSGAARAKLTFDAAYADTGISLTVHSAPDSEWRKLSWWQSDDTRRLTVSELQK